MDSPLPRLPVPARPPVACTVAEVATLLRLLAALPADTLVIGTAADPVSRANAALLAAAWPGEVLDTVVWPEAAASWLRQARRFTAPAPDAWLVTGTPAGWVGMGRRLAHSTGWSPRRTVATSGLADPVLVAAGGPDTFDGLRGARPDGRRVADLPDAARVIRPVGGCARRGRALCGVCGRRTSW